MKKFLVEEVLNNLFSSHFSHARRLFSKFEHKCFVIISRDIIGSVICTDVTLELHYSQPVRTEYFVLVINKIKTTITCSLNYRYPHLPCLKCGAKKVHYLPMEVCTIIPCIKERLSPDQLANMIRSTARPAPERQQAIQDRVCLLNST